MDRQDLMNRLSALWAGSTVTSSQFAPWSFGIEVPGHGVRLLVISEKWASDAKVEDVIRLARGLQPGEHLITREGRLHTASSGPAVRFDFALCDPQGQVTALIEAKAKVKTNVDWAIEWRFNCIARATGRAPPSMLVVASDFVYGWSAGAGAREAPSWTVAADTLLRPYFERLRLDRDTVSPRVFEDVVRLWLQDVVEGRTSARPDAMTKGFLVNSQGARVLEEFAW
ncbi:MAG: hypothetical protein JWQ07_4081 [Ramlibacter sp.]|nr:hypothetical protein [Ramlibacter sp.]